mgnify:CR=1 FL=1
MDPVIVVGAGPVGLALALLLAEQDVPSVVLDEGDGHVPRRAAVSVVLRPDTAALAARLGCRSAATATRWRAWTVRRRRQTLECVVYGTPVADGPSAAPAAPRSPSVEVEDAPDRSGMAERHPTEEAPRHLLQYELVEELRAAAARSDLVRLVPGVRLGALEQDEHGVVAHCRGSDGRSWRGTHLVGCDGARSTVRKLLGVRFPGRTAVERHAVATVRARLPWPGEALLHLEPLRHQGPSEVVARPLPDGRWRLDWLLPSRGETVTPPMLLELLEQTLSVWCDGLPDSCELLDTGVYLVHQRLARRWRVGRAFLAGDAAHLLGSLGTQQVDEGLRDAANLAWKLAFVRRHAAVDALLDSYEAERRRAVVARLRAVDHALPRVRGGPLRGLLPGAARERAALLRDGHLGRGTVGSPAAHTHSPLTPRDTVETAVTDTPPGGLTPDLPLIAADGARTTLRDRLGGRLLVVLVAPGTRVWDSRHWLSAGLMPTLAEAVDRLPCPAELLVAEDYPGAAAHTVLLVRPDGHLAAALSPGHTDHLRRCVDTVCGRSVAETAAAER